MFSIEQQASEEAEEQCLMWGEWSVMWGTDRKVMSDSDDTPQFSDEIVTSLKSIVQDFCDVKRTESQTLTLLYGTAGEAAVKLELRPEHLLSPLECRYNSC
ncbi:hypothetical protein EDD18DRAFT_1111178 [Armillaria luteobubalina]|uniref:Uncharacterized protein n=1 Tax=Armillaria luteobubalina TaxID=153913 RepID=A0AA39UKH7_9AGAR|nr:hypothetical protein EDD18DRAFT_1111178 [Armillaria luteobubalina]